MLNLGVNLAFTKFSWEMFLKQIFFFFISATLVTIWLEEEWTEEYRNLQNNEEINETNLFTNLQPLNIFYGLLCIESFDNFISRRLLTAVIVRLLVIKFFITYECLYTTKPVYNYTQTQVLMTTYVCDIRPIVCTTTHMGIHSHKNPTHTYDISKMPTRATTQHFNSIQRCVQFSADVASAKQININFLMVKLVHTHARALIPILHN